MTQKVRCLTEKGNNIGITNSVSDRLPPMS